MDTELLSKQSKRILSFVNENHYKDVPIKIAKALGFDYGRCFTRWRVLNRNYRLFLRYEAMRLEGIDPSAALRKLASEARLEVWQLRRYLNSFAQQFTNSGFDGLVEIRQFLDLDLDPHSMVAEPGYNHHPERPSRSELIASGSVTPPVMLFTEFEIDGLDIDKIDYLCRLKQNEAAHAADD